MDITGPFVLKQDIMLIPCAEIREDARQRISFQDGDYTLSQRNGRMLARVVDGETAALLALFREPRTIVDAVAENSRQFHHQPKARLQELLPHLGAFLDGGVLVPAGSGMEAEVRPRFESGMDVEGWTVIRCASFVEDSEVYQVSRGGEVAALKIARDGTGPLRRRFENEAEVLRRLDGTGIAPRLIAMGSNDDRPYLLLEWIAGVDARVIAAKRRHDRAALLDLCTSIAAAYAALHQRGVLHGDVDSRNILIGEKVVLLDCGYSRIASHPPASRSGTYFFFEPEYVRNGRALPLSYAGEQYSIAALLYFLITDRHYLDFCLEREEIERQIETEPPLPFAARGTAPWPELETILFHALEKDPTRRYGSMETMAALLTAVGNGSARALRETPLSEEATALLEATLRALARGGATFVDGFRRPPTASIKTGAAGAAVGLLRIAEMRDDPSLLALADVWRSRATALIGADDAYYCDTLTRELLGDVTPYYTESGIHAAAAMVAAAMGDAWRQQRAVSAFIRASKKPCAEIDLTQGRSGSLLAAALLYEISGNLAKITALRKFGSQTMSGIWDELDARPPIAASPFRTYSGMAHGWAGYLYAALRWCAASGDSLPLRLVERLHEYAALKTLDGRGAIWPSVIGKRLYPTFPGWCNGSAGQVFLFTLAHRLLGDEQWLRLADLAAWNNWEERRNPTTLCCGTAGRAYALLNFYRHTGGSQWLSRARDLANHAAARAVKTSRRTNALYQGELGVAVLIADLASPENARMPFFE